MEQADRQRQIQEHLEAIRRLQTQAAPIQSDWPPQGYYLLWHIVVGLLLGMIGAAVALALNAAGAPLVDKHPLELIRVYLTFPMGEAALTATSGEVLTIGCILYLMTGALYGVVFHLLMSLYVSEAGLVTRLLVATLIGLVIWAVNFYLILSWLQPMLLGGNWILQQIPFWVAGLTHLAFAWTMLLVESWGRFEPRGRGA